MKCCACCRGVIIKRFTSSRDCDTGLRKCISEYNVSPFEKFWKSSRYKNYRTGCLLGLIETLEKDNVRLKVINHLFQANCETKGLIGRI